MLAIRCEICRMEQPASFSYGMECEHCSSELIEAEQQLDEDWETYLKWNKAVAEVIWKPEFAGKPVYLDFEDEELQEITTHLPDIEDVEEFKSELGLVIYRVLDFSGSKTALNRIYEEQSKWRNTEDVNKPPPTILLLAALSIVAEEMRNDEKFKANNFYGRVKEFLQISDDEEHEKFKKSYSAKPKSVLLSKTLWETIEIWLVRNSGNLGLPTATNMGHRNTHIYWAISQALIREKDREALEEFFLRENFSPISPPAKVIMTSRFDKWINKTTAGVSKGLKNIWKNGQANGARERIVDQLIDAIPLQSYISDGQDISAGKNKNKLLIYKRKRPTGTVFRFGFCTEFSTVGQYSYEVETEQGFAAIAPVPLSENLSFFEPVDSDAEFWSTALRSVVKFKIIDKQTPLFVQHVPRRVVPFRRDPQLSAYLEADSVELNQEMLILVDRGLSEFVDEILGASALPGFKRIEARENNNIPEGWEIFTDVRITDLLSSEMYEKKMRAEKNLEKYWHLLPLFAAPSFEVIPDGGFKLPGYLRTLWHVERPPVIYSSITDNSQLSAGLVKNDDQSSSELPLHEYQAGESRMVWDLQDLDLREGDYTITVTASNGSKKEQRRCTFILCSSQNPSTIPIKEIRYMPS